MAARSLRARSFFTALTAVAVLAASAGAGIVYDGASGSGTQTVAAQSNLQFVTLNNAASQVAAGGKTTLNSTALGQAGQGGYFSHLGAPGFGVPVAPINPTWPAQNTMTAATGYTVRFDIAVTQEAHNADNQRAGFSVILISGNLKGIELGFWTDRLFAYEGGTGPSLFTPAEFASRDNTALTRFEYTVLGNDYAVFINQHYASPILTGVLRDYTAFNAAGAGLPFNPYAVNDFMFLGDNTSRGQSVTEISYIAITAGAIPSPGATALAALAGVVLMTGRRRKPC